MFIDWNFFQVSYVANGPLILKNVCPCKVRSVCMQMHSLLCIFHPAAIAKMLMVLYIVFVFRFPIMTALCFELNVPYAYWASGNFRRALQAFFRLYKEPSVPGRLVNFFLDVFTTCKLAFMT